MKKFLCGVWAEPPERFRAGEALVRAFVGTRLNTSTNHECHMLTE